MRKKCNIGNPAAIYAASEIAKSEEGQKAMQRITTDVNRVQKVVKTTGKVVGISILTAVVAYLSYKGIKYANRQALLKKAVSDPEIKTAVDIWNCVPDGYKNKFKLIEFNPLKRIEFAYDEIATLWKGTNTDRLMQLAKRIYDNKLKVNRISRVFKTLYGMDLITLINKVLTPAQNDVFSNYIYRGSGSVTPKVAEGLYAISKQAVTLRSAPNIPGFFYPENKIKNIGAGILVGQVTGREETYTESNKSTVFIEILVFNSKVNKSKYSTPVWAWKGALDFVDKQKASSYKAIDVDTEKNAVDFIVDNNPIKKLYNSIF